MRFGNQLTVLEPWQNTGRKAMERLFEYLRKLILGGFTGRLTINIVNGKVMHVDVTTNKVLEYEDLYKETKELKKPA